MVRPASHPGPAVRRLRRHSGLKQAAMARQLGISASYLNLIEHGQRPLPANLADRLERDFGFDPASVRDDLRAGGVPGLMERLADPRFAGLGIGAEEVTEWLAAAPQTALAFARLFDSTLAAPPSPLAQVEAEIARRRGHFEAIDRAAEALAMELGAPGDDFLARMVARIEAGQGLAVTLVEPAELEAERRRTDPAARQLLISAALDPASRQFQLAEALVTHELRESIAEAANQADLADREAWRLLRRHLISYAAAALIMPHGRLLRAATAAGFDLATLQRRFAVSFEQLAQRLTTLTRERQPGLPFAMLRLDRAGQISKRFAGASRCPLATAAATCPRWQWHAAFAAPGGRAAQWVELADGAGSSRWWTVAQRVGGASEHVVVLILGERWASRLPAAGPSGASHGEAPIGPGCALCPRGDCPQRAVPATGRQLRFDERVSWALPYAAEPAAV